MRFRLSLMAQSLPIAQEETETKVVWLTGCIRFISLSGAKLVTTGHRLCVAPNARNLLLSTWARLRGRQRQGYRANHFLGSEPRHWASWAEQHTHTHTLTNYHPLLSETCKKDLAWWSRTATAWLQSNCPAPATSSYETPVMQFLEFISYALHECFPLWVCAHTPIHSAKPQMHAISSGTCLHMTYLLIKFSYYHLELFSILSQFTEGKSLICVLSHTTQQTVSGQFLWT